MRKSTAVVQAILIATGVGVISGSAAALLTTHHDQFYARLILGAAAGVTAGVVAMAINWKAGSGASAPRSAPSGPDSAR